MNNKKIIPLALGLLLLSQACNTPKEETNVQKTQAKKLSVIEVKTESYRKKIFAVGMLSLNAETKLSFKTGGIIEQINLEQGETAKQGELMAYLKPKELEANVSNARLQHEKIRRDLERVEALYADSVATLEQLQNAKTQLNAAENSLEAAEFNLRYSKIRAPYDGVVLRKLADENELIAAGNPVFVFGANTAVKKLNVNLTAREIGQVETGDSATIEFDALQGRSFSGKVIRRSKMADPKTNTFPVEIVVEDNEGVLYSGFVGKATIQVSEVREMIKIPTDALYQAKGSQGKVFVLKNGKARLTEVKFSNVIEDNIFVQEGLQEGDQIILEGVSYVKDGEDVEPKNGEAQ